MTEDVAKAEPQGSQEGGSQQERYEPDQLPVRGALFAAGGIAAGIAVALAIVSGLFSFYGWLEPITPAEPIQRIEQPTVAPGLQTTRQGERAAIEARAQAKLARYRWTNEAHTQAQVPIRRAMEILAERGWPDAEAAQ